MRLAGWILAVVLCITGTAQAGTAVVIDREKTQQQLAVLQKQLEELERQIAANPAMKKRTETSIRTLRESAKLLDQTVGVAPELDGQRFRIEPDGRLIELAVEAGRVNDPRDNRQPGDRRPGPGGTVTPPPPPANPPPVVVQPRPQPPVVVVQPTPPPVVVVQPAPTGRPTAPPAPQAIDQARLNQVLSAIRGESFRTDQVRVFEQATAQQYFLVSQVKQLIEVFTFSSDQVHVVEYLAPRILDRENSYQLYSVFTFSSDKEKVERILSQY